MILSRDTTLRYFSTAVVLTLFVAFAFPPMFASSASSIPKSIPQVGLNVNYPTPQSFINGLPTQGVTWIRQYGPNQNTPLIRSAGMNDLMVLNENAWYGNSSYSSYTDLRQLTTTQWYNLVYYTAKHYSYITNWEFLNEPTNLPNPNWTPQEYFKYLVPTYQALK